MLLSQSVTDAVTKCIVCRYCHEKSCVRAVTRRHVNNGVITADQLQPQHCELGKQHFLRSYCVQLW